MKKLGLLLLGMFFTFFSYSQGSKYIQFKLYKNIEFGLGLTQGTNTVELGVFSPAIAWGSNENFHEIQLLSISFFSRSKARNYSAGVEYSYNYCLSDDQQKKVQLYFGGGIGGSFRSIYSEIIRGTDPVSTSGKYLNFHAILIPRLTYKFKSNILLDISLPYKPVTFSNTRLIENDPSVPDNQQTSVFNETNYLLRALSLKVGATVNF